MWGAFKYIVVQSTDDSKDEFPFMFPSVIDHDEMWWGIHEAFKRTSKSKYVIIVSAGFIDRNSLECSGKSETLGIESRGIVDTELFRKYMP